jgi:hypothetical protein
MLGETRTCDKHFVTHFRKGQTHYWEENGHVPSRLGREEYRGTVKTCTEQAANGSRMQEPPSLHHPSRQAVLGWPHYLPEQADWLWRDGWDCRPGHCFRGPHPAGSLGPSVSIITYRLCDQRQTTAPEDLSPAPLGINSLQLTKTVTGIRCMCRQDWALSL